MRLLREGRIATAPDGDVDIASLQSYISRNRPPVGYVPAVEAARMLGIAPRKIHGLVVDGVLPGMSLARANGGTWVPRQALVDFDPNRLVEVGIQAPPPKGWLTSAQACAILGIGRSGLRWLVQRGEIRRRKVNRFFAHYAEKDVRARAAR